MTSAPEPPIPSGTVPSDSGSVPVGDGVARPRPGWTEIALGVIGYIAVTVVAVVVLAGSVIPGSPLLAVVGIAVSGVAALGAFALALVVRVRSAAAFGVRATTRRWLLVGLGAGVLAWLVNRVIVISYVLISGDTSNPQAALLPGATGGPVMLALTMLAGAVLVPIGEELFFRGVLTTALGRYGAWVAVIASSLVFALAHGLSIVLPAAFVLGVVNAVLLRRSGSVWPGVVAHGVNNALVFGAAAVLLS